MAHVHCPKCGERLNLPPIQETRGVRCGVGSKFMDRKGGIMNEMCLVSRVPHRFGRIVPAGLLICFTMLARVSSTLADEISPPTTQPAIPLGAQKLFAQASPAVVKIHTYNATGRPLGQGSGFLIDAAGTIVTNHHVIKDAASARVYIQNQPSLPVTRIVAVDKQADLAIIKVDGKDLPFLKLRVALPKVGEKVYAIGSPHDLTNTLSDGLVSGLRRDSGITEIQTSAPITHGSSGGPLLSSDGAVVGVTTKGRIGGGDLNFAVPAERVASLLKKPSLPSRSMSKLLKPPEAKAAEAPKVYKSLASLLSQIPRNLMPVGNKHYSSLQITLIEKWIAENATRGTVLGFSGKFRASGASSSSVGLGFENSVLPIHGRKGWLVVHASFDLRFTQDILKLKKGTNVTIHGEIARLETKWHTRKGYNYYVLTLYLSNCAFGKAPAPTKTGKAPKPTSKPTAPKRTDEDKARSQLSLARSYIGAGLKTKAMDVLKELIARYPKTRAATDAQAELEKLGKQ